MANLATSYANLVLGAAGVPFKLPKKRWGVADYRDVASIITELLQKPGESLTGPAATAALGRFARPLPNQQITRVLAIARHAFGDRVEAPTVEEVTDPAPTPPAA